MATQRSVFNFMAMAAAGVLLLSGCSETQLVSHWAKQVNWGQETQGTYKIGNPYKVGSVWYYPEENFHLVETGIASWYGPGFHADHTANGEVYDQNELTAAHRTLQLPSLVRVTNLENGRSVVVRVNDRGPFLHGRIMDVSRRAAELLGFINKGTARVRLEVLEKESRILASAAKRGEDTTHMTLADLQGSAPVSAQPAVERGPAMAEASSGGEAMPESLRTPTITVEELSAPGAPKAASVPAAPEAYRPVPRSSSAAPAQISMRQGRALPDPVVTTEPVHTTGIFIQAGSFSVEDNARNLTKKLSKIGRTTIEPVTVGGRQFYRVKVGPISTVAKADAALEKVIALTGGGKVIKN